MMKELFVISDTHFGHKRVCLFKDKITDQKIRPWDDVDQMNEDMIALWNDVVPKNGRVFHLGDVVINKRYLPILDRLNGTKVLIKGNHDIFKLKHYLPYFEDIRAYRVVDKVIMSHIPIHPMQKERYIGNIHGHLHERKLDDPFYKCVSVEQTGFKPVPYDELIKDWK